MPVHHKVTLTPPPPPTNPGSSTVTLRGEWTIRSWELKSYLHFFFQEGNTTVSLNGETKKISKDDVLLIPSGAKWVTWLFFIFSFAFLFLIGPVNLYLWVNCIFSRYVFLGNFLSIQWVKYIFFILTCRYTVKRSKGSIGLSVVMDPMANK